jgi:hypothetical protein
VRPQRVTGRQRLPVEDVETGTAHVPGAQSSLQGNEVDNVPARRIDDYDARFHHGERVF